MIKYTFSTDSKNIAASKMQMRFTTGGKQQIYTWSRVWVKHYQVLQSKSSHLKLARTDATEVRREGGGVK